MAHTVTPQADAEGNVVGFDVQGKHEGYWKGSDSDYVEIEGQQHHRFENVEVNEEYTDTSDDYYNTLATTYPDLQPALQWASKFLPPDAIADYHSALDSDNWEQVNETLEYIVNNYRQSGTEVEEQPTEETEDEFMSYDDLTPEDQEQVADIVDSLSQVAPSAEQVDYWEQAVSQAQQAGDDCYAGVAAATAAFHAGEVTAEEAIAWVLQSYDIRDVSRVFQSIQN